MTFTAYCQSIAPQYGVHHLTIAKRIRAGRLPCPPMHKENKRAFYVVDSAQDETIPALKAENSRLKAKIADAIAWLAFYGPVGYTPNSAKLMENELRKVIDQFSA